MRAATRARRVFGGRGTSLSAEKVLQHVHRKNNISLGVVDENLNALLVRLHHFDPIKRFFPAVNDNGAEQLDALRTEIAALHEAHGLDVVVDMVHGAPGDALLAYVAQQDVDHIVIGHTERGALARWLVGSTATDVLARAHVPVTVVR